MNITKLNLIIAHLVIRAMMRAMMLILRKKNSMNNRDASTCEGDTIESNTDKNYTEDDDRCAIVLSR